MSTGNPWFAVGDSEPFVLPAHAEPIRRFNRSARSQHLVHLQAPPEPFAGDPSAPVVVLNLNPRFDPAGLEIRRHLPEFLALSPGNLRHEPLDGYPFYLLHPALEGDRGRRWWEAILGHLIRDHGHAKVARSVLCVEFFPYRTEKFTRRLPRLQSQQYGFDLVRSAVRRGAVVVFLRGERLWSETVPELTKTARTPAAVLNKRRPYLSPGNLPPGVYALVSQVVERR